MVCHKWAAKASFLGVALAATVMLGIPASPAASVRIIKVSAVSFKFTPDILAFHEGDRVILQLSNDDPRRTHAIASPYFSTVEVSVRGPAKILTIPEGWKSIQLEPGQAAEVEFMARGHGQWSFICPVFNHAAQGETGAFVVWPAGYRP